MAVHPTALIAPGAALDSSVEVGPYAVIGPKVRIGAGTVVGAHAVIEGRTTLGQRNRVFQFAALGAVPQDLKFAGEDTTLEIGDDNQIREFVTMHLGTAGGGGVTRIGNGNLFMANSHVAHDAIIADRGIFANSVAIAGHVLIDDDVHIGGLAGVHQFCRLGRFSFVGAGAIVTQDVPPYCTVHGNHAELVGMNSIGLQRAGYTPEQLSRIKAAYKLLFRAKLGLREALAQCKAELGGQPEIDHLLGFIEASKRGICR